MSVKHRITVNLDESEYAALQRIADNADRSMAWVGRKAICDLINAQERAATPLFAKLSNFSSSAENSVKTAS